MSWHIINGNRLDYSGGMHKGASRVFLVSSYSPLASMIETPQGGEKQEGSCYRPLMNERCHLLKIDGPDIVVMWRCCLIESRLPFYLISNQGPTR